MGANAVIEYSNGSIYEGYVKEKQNQKQSKAYKLPHGRGIITFQNGNKIQGEFVEGQLHHGYLCSQDFMYTGHFRDQSINGQGILTQSSNTFYEGQFQNGRFKKGIITKKNDSKDILYTYQGQIHELQRMKGKGKLQIQLKSNKENINSNGRILEGEFIKGNLQGNGRYQFQNGDFYKGNFQNGRPSGQTFFKSKNMEVTGYLTNNALQGEVKIIFSNRDIYEGEIKDGKMHGRGKYTFANGTIYQGQFYHGQQWGQCKITYPPNSQIQAYEGQVNEGRYQGLGILYFANGVIFKGFFCNGMKHGFGVLIYGKSKYKCLYILNKLTGKLKQFDDN